MKTMLWVTVSVVIATHVTALTTLASEPPVLELVQTIDLKGPEGKLDHFALDTKRDRLLVANQCNDSLDVVDLKEGKLLRQVSGQKQICGIAYVPELDRIFVGNNGGTCNVFNAANYELIKSIPLPEADNVRYDLRNGLVYVGNKSLVVLDPKAMSITKDIILPGGPRAFRSEPDRPRLYCNTSQGVVCVIDTDKLELTQQYPIRLAGSNYALALDPGANRVFVGCRKEPKLVVLDSETGKEIASVDIPNDVDDLAYDPKSKRIYASCGEGFLVVISQADNDQYKVVLKIATAKLARTSLFDPDTGRVFVGVPRQPLKDGPEIRVFRSHPSSK